MREAGRDTRKKRMGLAVQLPSFKRRMKGITSSVKEREKGERRRERERRERRERERREKRDRERNAESVTGRKKN